MDSQGKTQILVSQWEDETLSALVTRESRFIGLNLIVLLALFVTHLGIMPLQVTPPSILVFVLLSRVVMLVAELWWVRTRRSDKDVQAIRTYANASLLFTIAFAFAVSVIEGTEDSHYSVLMVTPVIAAAFRFSLVSTLVVAGMASVFTIMQVWLYERLHPPVRISEFFEAATVALIFLLVSVVVWQLVDQLRRESSRLRSSFVELATARDRLADEKKLAAIGRLSSAIAHEIRNPVAMISSSLATANRACAPGAVRDEMLSIAATEAARLEQMTTDFLSYARAKPPDRKPADLPTVLGYVADLAKSRAAEHGITFEVECPCDTIVWVDQFQIHQALLNLITNAIDATPSGGLVRFGCRARNDNRIEVSVENSGEAIAPVDAERVFEPFYTTKASGTGLGLGIARNIALAHGGDLALTRNDPGHVTFAFVLPLGDGATSTAK